MGILAIGERQRVRLFVRRDPFGRFVSCLVFVPRDRFNTENRERIARGACARPSRATLLDWSVLFSESVLVRVHFVLGIDAGGAPSDPTTRRARGAARRDHAQLGRRPARRADRGARRGGGRGAPPPLRATPFPAAYRADWPARSAVADIERAEESVAGGGLGMALYRAARAARGGSSAASCSAPSADLALGRAADVREHGRADHRRAALRGDAARDSPACGSTTSACSTERAGDFDAGGAGALPGGLHRRLERGAMRTTASTGSSSRRGCAAARSPSCARSPSTCARPGRRSASGYLQQALTANAEIASCWSRCFAPASTPTQTTARRRERARRDDRVGDRRRRRASTTTGSCATTSRSCAAMTRTDYFQARPDGAPSRRCASSSTRSSSPLLPEPRPRFEIFVYSPRVEGVHLRGGLVARGGLRWSDRREDFRTEVLGLMKAQMVKNARDRPVRREGRLRRQAAAAGGRRAA